MYKGSLTVYIGRVGKIAKIGEYFMNYCDVPNMSEASFNQSYYNNEET